MKVKIKELYLEKDEHTSVQGQENYRVTVIDEDDQKYEAWVSNSGSQGTFLLQKMEKN